MFPRLQNHHQQFSFSIRDGAAHGRAAPVDRLEEVDQSPEAVEATTYATHGEVQVMVLR